MNKQLIKLSKILINYDLKAGYLIRRLAHNFSEGKKHKTILILIHPDCAVELSRNDAENYLHKIKMITPSMFDKIFVNYFFSYDFTKPGWLYSDHPNYDILLQIREHLNNISSHVHDRNMGKVSFSGPIADYLIENEEVLIHIGGGYQDLCLKQSVGNFCSILNWLVKEHDHEVIIEKQLVYYRNISMGPKSEYRIDPWWEEEGIATFEDTITFPDKEN